MLSRWLLNGFGYFVSLLTDRGIDRLARTLTFVFYKLFGLRKRVLQKNIAIAFPKKSAEERADIAEKSVYHFFMTALELLHARKGDLADQVDFEGLHHLREALSQGKGAYILALHLSNWEALGAALTRQVSPTHVVVKPVGNRHVDDYVRELRTVNRFIPIARPDKGDAVKLIREALAKNEMIGFVLDQNRHDAPMLPFFSQPTPTNPGLATLCRRYPAPVIPVYILRTGSRKFKAKALPAMNLGKSSNPRQDILTMSGQFNQVLEAIITEHPEQYFWLHNRWKHLSR